MHIANCNRIIVWFIRYTYNLDYDFLLYTNIWIFFNKIELGRVLQKSYGRKSWYENNNVIYYKL